MRKVVAFSAGSTGISKGAPTVENPLLEIKDGDVKKFSVSSIRQRVKEKKFSLKIQFRFMIRDYRKVFQSAKEGDIGNIKKLFYEDLLMLFSEAVNGKNKQINLNRELMITSLVPTSRKVVNQLNIVTRKIDKFYTRQGYINKQMQIEFTKLMKSLAMLVLDAVYKGEIDEEQLSEENDEKVIEMHPRSQYRLAACATKSGRCILFAAEDVIDEIISDYDLDEEIEDANTNSLTLFGSMDTKSLPAEAKMSRRIKAFSSNFIAVKFIVENKDSEDLDDLLSDAIQLMNQKGVVSTIDPEYNYDAEKYGDNAILFTVYFPENKTQLTKDASESNGIYIDVDQLPDEPKYLFGPNNVDAVWDQLQKLIDAGAEENKIDIEDILVGVDTQKYKELILQKYGEEIANSIIL